MVGVVKVIKSLWFTKYPFVKLTLVEQPLLTIVNYRMNHTFFILESVLIKRHNTSPVFVRKLIDFLFNVH